MLGPARHSHGELRGSKRLVFGTRIRTWLSTLELTGNVTIAIVDSGIDRVHEDLAENIAGGVQVYWDSFWQEIKTSTDYQDGGGDGGHGTAIAGVVAAVDNDECIIGASPYARIFAVRLGGYSSDIIAYAIEHAANLSDVKVMILPFSYRVANDPDRLIESACNYAYSNGKLLVGVSGNHNIGESWDVEYPGNLSSVLAVGATYPNDTRCEFSKYGPGNELVFMAPGYNVTTIALSGGTTPANGTSFAAPHVAAAAALVFASKIVASYDYNENGVWEAYEVVDILIDKALNESMPQNEYGYGLINAYQSSRRPEGNINSDDVIDIF